MNLHLTGRIAFVAGSSRGIGKAIALSLLREGCRVCITGRDALSLEATRAELARTFGESHVLSAAGDLTGVKVVEETLGNLVAKWGGLDLLVANLGTGAGKPGWQQDESEWERLFEQNFFGSVRLAQAAIPHMQARGGGGIVFISSIAGVEALPAPLPYGAAKAALLNYSKNLSRAAAGFNIRVNSVAPGNVLFPGGSWERRLAGGREAVEHYIASEVPAKRFGTPEEIASLVTYLCSPVSGFATGGCHIMDGGQSRCI